jgi:serine protease
MSVARSTRAAVLRSCRTLLTAGLTAGLTAAFATACVGEIVDTGPASKGDHAAADDPGASSPVSAISHFVRSPNAIPGEYIVVMRDDVAFAAGNDVQALSSSLATLYRGHVGMTFGSALRGFVSTMSEADAIALSDDPRVAFVEENGRVNIATTVSVQATGLDRIDQDSAPIDGKYTFNADGTGVVAYVIDTGVRATHTQFQGRATFLKNFTNDGIDTDCNDHGTHVSGTIAGKDFGVARNAQIRAIKVLGCNGSGSNAGVIAGINFAVQNFNQTVKPNGGKAVANMSLGGGFDAGVNSAVAGAVAAGIVFVVAAGNENADACNGSPSSAPDAITVAALDNYANGNKIDRRASFSNFGKCVDIFAPGFNILSSTSKSDTSTALFSGTSMATPHVVGVAALFLSANPAATPQQTADFLTKTGAIVGTDANPRVQDLKGSPDVMLFTGRIGNNTPPPTTPPPTTPPPTTPPVGTPNSGVGSGTVNAGQQFNFQPIPKNPAVLLPGSTLTVTLSGNQGDADLYVRFGQTPTLTRFNCRPFLDTSNGEVCVLKVPAGQTKAFISVRGDVAPDGTLTADFAVKASWVEK